MTKEKEEELIQKVLQELTSLQTAHKQILDKYALNTKAQLAELIDFLMGKGGDHSSPPSKGKLKEMLDELDELKLKPEKGRGKDLYRISSALDRLQEVLEG